MNIYKLQCILDEIESHVENCVELSEHDVETERYELSTKLEDIKSSMVTCLTDVKKAEKEAKTPLDAKDADAICHFLNIVRHGDYDANFDMDDYDYEGRVYNTIVYASEEKTELEIWRKDESDQDVLIGNFLIL